jgi:hypothetical protein
MEIPTHQSGKLAAEHSTRRRNLKTTAGVFTSRAEAERVGARLASAGIPKEKITVLIPKDSEAKVRSVPTTTTEQPGMGVAMGGVVGAAAGMAGGFGLGEVVVTAAIPGIGPVIALGLLGAVVLGWIGAKVGEKLDEAATEGLPADELFVYEDALRKGRSVVIAFADDEDAADAARRVMEEAGAESIDAARKEWWIGLRSGEKEHYATPEKDFDRDERFYRRGFEAALHARNRGTEYDQIQSEMGNDIEELERRYPGDKVEDPFRRGFERGRAYYETSNKLAASARA